MIFEAANENETSLITLINPKIEVLTKETSIDWEGCLSVPGLRGKVSRPNKIKYTGLDIEGNKIETIAEGFDARVVQHECDHLIWSISTLMRIKISLAYNEVKTIIGKITG